MRGIALVRQLKSADFPRFFLGTHEALAEAAAAEVVLAAGARTYRCICAD